MAPKLVIFLEGGLIQDMCSSEEMEVLVLDYDTEGCDETKKIVEWDFINKMLNKEECNEVFDSVPWNPGVQPMAVDHYFRQMEGGEVNADEVVSEVQEDKGKGK